jgi:hypothetical protein
VAPGYCHKAAAVRRQPRNTYVMLYAVAATATSMQRTTTNAGSSRAHWFFVCLWYDVCRYLHDNRRHRSPGTSGQRRHQLPLSYQRCKAVSGQIKGSPASLLLRLNLRCLW